MLKKVALLFVCLWVPFTQAAPQFKENVNYEVIQPVVSAQPEVMEYFSFFCPHCYQFEPVMEELKKQLPQGVAFPNSSPKCDTLQFKRLASFLQKPWLAA